MKDEDYLVHNINKIANHLEKINWNLGKIASVLCRDIETLNKIDEAMKEGVTKEE